MVDILMSDAASVVTNTTVALNGALAATGWPRRSDGPMRLGSDRS